MARLKPPRPLAEEDDREGFDCGRESMSQWFRRHAWRNQSLGTTRTTVLCDGESGVIAGYVSLSMGQIEREFLPKGSRRDTPDVLPVFLLGQLAVDRRFQGRGIARSLLFYALKTSVLVSRQVGCFGVLTHPLDDGVRDFYCRFGFEDLPGDPRRSMLVRIKDLERSGFETD